jgi:hypothetical protein
VIEVDGFDGAGALVAESKSIATFQEGMTLNLGVLLRNGCLGEDVICPAADQTCASDDAAPLGSGQCESIPEPALTSVPIGTELPVVVEVSRAEVPTPVTDAGNAAIAPADGTLDTPDASADAAMGACPADNECIFSQYRAFRLRITATVAKAPWPIGPCQTAAPFPVYRPRMTRVIQRSWSTRSPG